MIRDGFINIYGCMTEDYVEGDPRPCPKCGMSDIKVIRAMEYEPQGFRLGCIHCGYEVPEEDMGAYNLYERNFLPNQFKNLEHEKMWLSVTTLPVDQRIAFSCT